MTTLTEELSRLMAADAEAGRLDVPNGIDGENVALEAAKLAQPLVVNALADWAIDAGSNLVAFLQSAGTDADQLANEDEPALRLFGKRLLPATNAVKVEARIPDGSAVSILETCSAAALTALARRVADDGLDRQSLAELLSDERASLVDGGWGPWVEMVGRGDHLVEPNTVSTPLNSSDSVRLDPPVAAPGHDAMPDQESTSPASSEPSEPLPDDGISIVAIEQRDEVEDGSADEELGVVADDPATGAGAVEPADEALGDDHDGSASEGSAATSDRDASAQEDADEGDLDDDGDPADEHDTTTEPIAADEGEDEPDGAADLDPADDLYPADDQELADDQEPADDQDPAAADLDPAEQAGSAEQASGAGGDDNADEDDLVRTEAATALRSSVDDGLDDNQDSDGEQRSSGKRAPVLAGVVGAAVLVGSGLFALLSSGGGATSTDDGATSTEDAAPTSEVDGSTDAADDDAASTSSTTAMDETDAQVASDGEDESSPDDGTETVDVAQTDIVSIQVPMRDIKGFSTEAAGTAEFEFNTTTGQICYSFEAEGVEPPFATHIHVGADGIRGGIVVDFGSNESPASGCVDNPPDDTADILAFPSSHYAELHDASGAFTVRGQLSDAAPTEELPDLAFTDPDGGGAQAVIEAGRIVLRGPIADRATADVLAAQYAALGLAGIDVIDDLEITDDAPAPSGRVVLNDGILFAVGSADLGTTDQGVVDVLVAVALSEANSTMTIVGHTDSTGSAVANLELSLARANALRDVLVDAGVPLENLRVEGAGDTDPIGDNATAEGRAVNRRIEFELTPSAG